MQTQPPHLVDLLKRRYEDLRQAALDKIRHRQYKTLADMCKDAHTVGEAKREWQDVASRVAQA